MAENINTAIIERLEKVVQSLQENSVKMGELLAVHNEKLDKQDQIDGILFEKIDRLSADVNRETEAIKKGCERDIRMVDDRLRTMEKKMWSIFGALSIISFLVSPVGQRMIKPILTNGDASAMITEPLGSDELAFVNIGLIILCPTGLTRNDMILSAPKILHIFFSIVLSLSSTILISLSHPFFIASVSLFKSLLRLSIFSNKIPSI